MMFEHKEGSMDEKLQKKIIRQLRGIRMGLGLLLVVMIAGFAMLGFFIYKTSGLLNDAQKQIQSIESQTNSVTELKDKVCSNGLVTESTLCTN
jgi:uncharacterized membrane protein YciS (DUF1049 family)